MTAPRFILPGTTYLLTRRCSERRFFLRPCEELFAHFLYILAVAAERYGVQVHVLTVLSNHYHLLATDPLGELPRFMQYVDSLVARATNRRIKRAENLWSAEASYNAVRHGSREDVVAKAAYVLANPVAAGLVQHGHEWPGIRTAPEQLGNLRLTLKRPPGLFRDAGPTPESAELRLTLPSCFESVDEFQRLVSRATSDLEAEHRRRAQAEQRSFLGCARILAQSPFARPTTVEPRGGLIPRVAASDPEIRAAEITRERAFRKAYREAWGDRQGGKRDVVFPAGTYLLRVMHGARCAAVA